MMENKTKIDLKNKSVFITGVAGFIGSILLYFIVAKQLPISRRRSAANTFMWSQIARI